MASFKKDNKTVEISRGVKHGIIKDFKSKGLKVTKNGNVFENGYLEILLNNGVILSQYIMVIPVKESIFYKFVEAAGLAHKIDEFVDFPFEEMFEKEVVIELEYESVRNSKYLNVTNVYGMEIGKELIKFQRARDEARIRRGGLNMDYIEMINERRVEIENKVNKKGEVGVKEAELGDEYDELIGF
ncbi:hypothetical protein ABHA01_12445 [Clostridium paraputrificum]|uniref:hypothetical protein n=1 Tax=Clostridium paraputrificum TaxID=29363 RepID=UPI00325B8350